MFSERFLRMKKPRKIYNFLFMPPKEICPSVSPSVRFISPLLFEVGIPNLVCEYILGWQSVAYHFRVTVTMNSTSDLDFRIIVSGAYLLFYLR